MNIQSHINMTDLVQILNEVKSIIKEARGKDQAEELEERFYEALGSLISQVAALQLEEPDVLH